jgi:hypothetical protein
LKNYFYLWNRIVKIDPLTKRKPELPSDSFCSGLSDKLEMKEIKLSQGKVALVDDEDFEYLNQFKWHASGNSKYTYYAMHRNKDRNLLMHRIIMNTPDNLEVDHIDHNGLNNQRLNLRNCSHSENIKNMLIRNKKISCTKEIKIKSRGVSINIGWRKYINKAGEEKIYYSKPKFVAYLTINGKLKNLGRFETEEEANARYKEMVGIVERN